MSAEGNFWWNLCRSSGVIQLSDRFNLHRKSLILQHNHLTLCLNRVQFHQAQLHKNWKLLSNPPFSAKSRHSVSSTFSIPVRGPKFEAKIYSNPPLWAMLCLCWELKWLQRPNQMRLREWLSFGEWTCSFANLLLPVSTSYEARKIPLRFPTIFRTKTKFNSVKSCSHQSHTR